MSVRELTADLVVDARATLGEGARWDPQGRLYWVDIMAPALHLYDPSADTDTVVPVDRYLGAVVLRDSGGLLAAVHEGFAALDPTTGAVDLLATVQASDSGLRMNDGNCDPQGRFWAGSMALDERPGAGALYRFDTDGSVVRMLTDVTISNGIVWSMDGTTTYYIDTPIRRVDAFSFEPDSGTLRDRRPFVSLPPPRVTGRDDDRRRRLPLGRALRRSAVHRYTPADSWTPWCTSQQPQLPAAPSVARPRRPVHHHRRQGRTAGCAGAARRRAVCCRPERHRGTGTPYAG